MKKGRIKIPKLKENGPDIGTGTNEKGKDKDTKTKGKWTGYRDRN